MTTNLRSKRYAARVEFEGRLLHPDAPHGTVNGYTNYGCRCSRCTKANSDDTAPRMQARRAAIRASR